MLSDLADVGWGWEGVGGGGIHAMQIWCWRPERSVSGPRWASGMLGFIMEYNLWNYGIIIYNFIINLRQHQMATFSLDSEYPRCRVIEYYVVF